MKIRSIMNEEFETITPDASVEEAALLMKASGVGALPVKNNGEVLGVVTDRDITIKAIASGMDPRETPVQRIMTRELVYTNEDSSIEEALKSMKIHNIRRLLVLNDKHKLVGCIHIRQIKDIPEEQRRQKTVGELADQCNSSNTINQDVDAMKALSRMRKSGNSRLMVMDNGKLTGIVALKDMLEFLSTKVDLEDIPEND